VEGLHPCLVIVSGQETLNIQRVAQYSAKSKMRLKAQISNDLHLPKYQQSQHGSISCTSPLGQESSQGLHTFECYLAINYSINAPENSEMRELLTVVKNGLFCVMGGCSVFRG